MSKNTSKAIESIELYMFLQKMFKMSPDEAADEMKEHGYYTDEVCHAHTTLNKHALNQKGKTNETND